MIRYSSFCLQFTGCNSVSAEVGVVLHCPLAGAPVYSFLQAPLLPPAADGTSSGGMEILLPEFTAQKNLIKEVERLRTEIGGAPFAAKMFKEKPKRSADADETAVSLQDLLQPKKKARTAKRKAAPKQSSGASKPETLDEVEADVVDKAFGSSRKRWWIDDLLGSLIHAAGASGMEWKLNCEIQWVDKSMSR